MPEVMYSWPIAVPNVGNSGLIQKLSVKFIKKITAQPVPVAAREDVVIIRQLVEAAFCITV